ncbi:MAG TPA: hypoxanthine phosphoribosyltransferase [Euzebyales bacterium]|nr:hypoxanthine phosphoribosyltransferase [Euzebyales bacterium]
MGAQEVFGDDIEEVLIPAERVQQRLRELAADVTRDYAGQRLLLVGVLKGAFMVMADLARYLDLPIEVDFMAVSSYGSATKTSGVVRILKDLERDIADHHVLVVEDIVDSGLTLKYLLKNLAARGPRSLEVLTLLTKPDAARPELRVRYQGFEVPNVFVVGYGLDYAERYRNMPCIATLSPKVYE